MLVLSLYYFHVLKPSLLKPCFLERSNPIMPRPGPPCVTLGCTHVLSFPLAICCLGFGLHFETLAEQDGGVF